MSPERDAIIKVRNMVAQYGEDVILNRISFDVKRGERFVVLGGSGCGKSTLLRHLVGLNLPAAGSVYLDGINIADCSDDAFQDALRRIGVLFQSGALIGSMTLAENIALPILEYTDFSRPAVENLVRMKLNMVNLNGYENHLPSEISGGMKKRAGLARALALNPKVLFLDEPSAGLDPISSVELDELILHINRTIGTTMVIVTHELESIFKVAKRIVMLDKQTKGIIAEGDPHYLKDNSRNPIVSSFFNRVSDKIAP